MSVVEEGRRSGAKGAVAPVAVIAAFAMQFADSARAARRAGDAVWPANSRQVAHAVGLLGKGCVYFIQVYNCLLRIPSTLP